MGVAAGVFEDPQIWVSVEGGASDGDGAEDVVAVHGRRNDGGGGGVVDGEGSVEGEGSAADGGALDADVVVSFGDGVGVPGGEGIVDDTGGVDGSSGIDWGEGDAGAGGAIGDGVVLEAGVGDGAVEADGAADDAAVGGGAPVDAVEALVDPNDLGGGGAVAEDVAGVDADEVVALRMAAVFQVARVPLTTGVVLVVMVDQGPPETGWYSTVYCWKVPSGSLAVPVMVTGLQLQPSAPGEVMMTSGGVVSLVGSARPVRVTDWPVERRMVTLPARR
jgi:hypothetical protein